MFSRRMHNTNNASQFRAAGIMFLLSATLHEGYCSCVIGGQVTPSLRSVPFFASQRRPKLHRCTLLRHVFEVSTKYVKQRNESSMTSPSVVSHAKTSGWPGKYRLTLYILRTVKSILLKKKEFKSYIHSYNDL